VELAVPSVPVAKQEPLQLAVFLELEEPLEPPVTVASVPLVELPEPPEPVAQQDSLAQSAMAVLAATEVTQELLASVAWAVPMVPTAHLAMAERADNPVLQVLAEPPPPRFHLCLPQARLEAPVRLHFPATGGLAVSQEPLLKAQVLQAHSAA
jgi:hypothetical protein